MIVVDASALAAFILREEGWENLAVHLVYSLSLDHVVKEVANVIWRTAYLRRLISMDEARMAYNLLRKMVGKNVLLEPELDYLDKALEIALSWGITVYDALYLALALEKNLPILSLDDKQRRVAKNLGLMVKP
ncbi:MAG: VapC toxin family PIN domain ribonuclease [Thermoprotei archaeon]|nr:MAG: VapC toxin family PIN domain ribonuclease [Thermoprotei archaeon]